MSEEEKKEVLKPETLNPDSKKVDKIVGVSAPEASTTSSSTTSTTATSTAAATTSTESATTSIPGSTKSQTETTFGMESEMKPGTRAPTSEEKEKIEKILWESYGYDFSLPDRQKKIQSEDNCLDGDDKDICVRKVVDNLLYTHRDTWKDWFHIAVKSPYTLGKKIFADKTYFIDDLAGKDIIPIDYKDHYVCYQPNPNLDNESFWRVECGKITEISKNYLKWPYIIRIQRSNNFSISGSRAIRSYINEEKCLDQCKINYNAVAYWEDIFKNREVTEKESENYYKKLIMKSDLKDQLMNIYVARMNGYGYYLIAKSPIRNLSENTIKYILRKVEKRDDFNPNDNYKEFYVKVEEELNKITLKEGWTKKGVSYFTKLFQ